MENGDKMVTVADILKLISRLCPMEQSQLKAVSALAAVKCRELSSRPVIPLVG